MPIDKSYRRIGYPAALLHTVRRWTSLSHPAGDGVVLFPGSDRLSPVGAQTMASASSTRFLTIGLTRQSWAGGNRPLAQDLDRDRFARASRTARAAVALIRVYQRVAPQSLRAACRFTPTCSEYTIGAILKYGALRGVTGGLRRILRCRPPFGGVDEP